MKLSKRDRRILRNGLDDATSMVERVSTDWFLSNKHYKTLEELRKLLRRLKRRLDG